MLAGMAMVILNLAVPNAAQLAAFYDQILVFRATAGLSGPWSEITTPQTRLPLLAAQVTYPFSDPDGDAAYYYAAGFLNSETGDRSPIGEPVQGAGSDVPGVLSVQQLKDQYLTGLEMVYPDGTPFPDSFFGSAIKRALAEFERQTQLTVLPTVVTGELHDLWQVARPYAPQRLQSRRVPLQSVQALRLQLPYFCDSQPLPSRWLRITGNSGRITIFPIGAWLTPLIQQAGIWRRGMGWDDVVPNGWALDYVAGFPAGQVPADILDAVGKMASMEPLRIAGDLFAGAGYISQSLGIDGLSQSTGTTKTSQGGAYQGRISAYQQDLADPTRGLAALRLAYRGILYGSGTS